MNNNKSDNNQPNIRTNHIHPSLICPYDLENKYGRCCYPKNKKGDCTCALRHISSSKNYCGY